MWGGNGKRVLGQHIHDKSSAVNLVIEEHHSIKNNVSYFNKKITHLLQVLSFCMILVSWKC